METQRNAVTISIVQYRTTQYSAEQLSTVQRSAVPYSTVQYSTNQCSAVQYRTMQYCTEHYSAMPCSAILCSLSDTAWRKEATGQFLSPPNLTGVTDRVRHANNHGLCHINTTLDAEGTTCGKEALSDCLEKP